MAVTKLYHRELGFPTTLVLPNNKHILLEYGYHALRAAISDKYGIINLPESAIIMSSDIIEVETIDNITPTKILVRAPYSDKYDLCLVILVKDRKVKTVWLNSVNDVHTTLNINKYNTKNV